MLILDFKKIKDYYDNKQWSKEMVANAVVKEKITEEEYKTITGEDYVVVA